MDEKNSNASVEPFNIKRFLPTKLDRTVTVEFKGVRFTVRYVSRQQLFTMAQQCQVLAYDKTSKKQTVRLDLPKMTRMVAEAIVVGWEGLTLDTLQNLMVLEGVDGLTEDQLKAPIPFDQATMQELLLGVNGLDDFLQEVSTDPSNFRTTSPEELEKNS